MCFRFGRLQSVKILNKHHGFHASSSSDATSPGGNGGVPEATASVSFMDITSACKANNTTHVFEERMLKTEFYDPNSGGHGYAHGHSASSNANSTSSGSSSSSSSSSLSLGAVGASRSGVGDDGKQPGQQNASIQGRLHG